MGVSVLVVAEAAAHLKLNLVNGFEQNLQNDKNGKVQWSTNKFQLEMGDNA